ncbi:MAG: hypothetical protein J3K34DRAFT_242166 [Monoraphidium minutum]|nr:MAG: hypothetical protein J3K34DRAFT_242166 [Monoraphidium minutum]
MSPSTMTPRNSRTPAASPNAHTRRSTRYSTFTKCARRSAPPPPPPPAAPPSERGGCSSDLSSRKTADLSAAPAPHAYRAMTTPSAAPPTSSVPDSSGSCGSGPAAPAAAAEPGTPSGEAAGGSAGGGERLRALLPLHAALRVAAAAAAVAAAGAGALLEAREPPADVARQIHAVHKHIGRLVGRGERPVAEPCPERARRHAADLERDRERQRQRRGRPEGGSHERRNAERARLLFVDDAVARADDGLLGGV